MKGSPLAVQILAALCLAVWAGWLAWQLPRQARNRSRARAEYFSACATMFGHVVQRVEPSGFARLSGLFERRRFDLQALTDSLTFRKLPALWVMVSLPEPLPLQATLDIMVRPTGNETFSHFSTLPQALPCPAFLPQGTGLRSDSAAKVVPQSLIERHAGLFQDVRVKELLISPKGLRVVVLADEAERGAYLMFRDAELGRTPLPAQRLKPLLAALTALQADILALAEQAAA